MGRKWSGHSFPQYLCLWGHQGWQSPSTKGHGSHWWPSVHSSFLQVPGPAPALCLFRTRGANSSALLLTLSAAQPLTTSPHHAPTIIKLSPAAHLQSVTASQLRPRDPNKTQTSEVTRLTCIHPQPSARGCQHGRGLWSLAGQGKECIYLFSCFSSLPSAHDWEPLTTHPEFLLLSKDQRKQHSSKGFCAFTHSLLTITPCGKC